MPLSFPRNERSDGEVHRMFQKQVLHGKETCDSFCFVERKIVEISELFALQPNETLEIQG